MNFQAEWKKKHLLWLDSKIIKTIFKEFNNLKIDTDYLKKKIFF